MAEEPEGNSEPKQEKKEKITGKINSIPKGYWMLATGALAILLIIILFTGIKITEGAIGISDAGQKTVDYLNSKTGGGVELVEVNEQGSLYEVVVLYQEQEIPVYITKDGKFIVQGVMPITTQTTPTTQTPSQNISKSDKPKVELFVMTHCPYGTQAEKGIIPVLELLGDKIDGKIRFVHYFMHDPEKAETPIQVCIREEQPDKYLDYLKEFLKEGDSDAALIAAGIDKTKLETCKSNKADAYYEADSALSENYGVRGSPTLVINNQIISAARNSASLLTTICSAFNQAPEECSQTLSSENPSPGFGYSTTSSSTTAQC